jgi:tetratricopeptide (TPR) repeat protein
VADDSRISELERRVASDPASIAFAQLAEEYRRAGRLDDAVRVCRTGLARHPMYPSARATLGRALLAQGLHEEARVEIDAAAAADPDNIAATRAVEEWRRVCGSVGASTPTDGSRVLAELEGWLAAVLADRAQRAPAAGRLQRRVAE